ncbi:MAG: hypothetical protein D6820_08915, partial [Lentisphaerae bacterium]
PPLFSCILWLALARYRLILLDPLSARTRYAVKHFRRRLRQIERDDDNTGLMRLEEALRIYVADKLRLKAYAHTFEEILPQLRQRGLSTDEISRLEFLYRIFDEKRFHLCDPDMPLSELIAYTRNVVKSMEKRCRTS